MNEIEEILSTASEPLPRVECVIPQKPSCTSTPLTIKTKEPKMEIRDPQSTPSETPATPHTETQNREAPRSAAQAAGPARPPLLVSAMPYSLDAGDNWMETALRVLSELLLVGGIGYSIYLAAEIGQMGRHYGGDGATGLYIFIIGTVVSILVWAVLNVLCNLSVNARTSKHLLARILWNDLDHQRRTT